jgi:hypothetical protein
LTRRWNSRPPGAVSDTLTAPALECLSTLVSASCRMRSA